MKTVYSMLELSNLCLIIKCRNDNISYFYGIRRLILLRKELVIMKTYRDFDNYLKNFPDEKGYFGEYGGMILPPELVPAFKDITEAYAEICNNARFINE